MAKKRKSRKPSLSPEQQMQRTALRNLREELIDLHEISVMVMSDQGVLPPLYGGEHLGENREVIPLWGITDEKPELGALLLRVQPGVEPNLELQAMRVELDLQNDWPVSELLDVLVRPDGKSMVEDADEIRNLSMILALFGNQVVPAPGYDGETMVEHIADMQPYAVFPIVPISGDEDDLIYQWENLDGFRAEVVYADSPQLLEAAVWEYRLNRALQADVDEIIVDGGNPDEELMAQNVAGLSALYELLVMQGIRFYGSTSPIRTRQQELDVLREENGDLIIKGPLKSEIEPLVFLADARKGINPNEHGEIMHLRSEEDSIQRIWPQVRASNVFCIRVRHGTYAENSKGQARVSYSPSEIMEWAVADSLPDLYRQVRLGGIYEMLGTCGLVKARIIDLIH
jgi:hypothetical protein